MNILIVDDEKEIADLVSVVLKNEGYNTFTFYNPSSALAELQKNDIDLAIIDVMMPEIDGFCLCEKIRKNYNFPVIMLTARVEDIDKITGLSVGADDYITKPFNPLELLARVKAQLRRYKSYNSQFTSDSESFDHHGLYINNKEHTVFLYDKEVNLTPTEFKILWLLCKNSGEVVSSEKIFQAVWGEAYLDCNNTVMVHIRRIREKLNEPNKNPKFIKTVWGVGYKIEK